MHTQTSDAQTYGCFFFVKQKYRYSFPLFIIATNKESGATNMNTNVTAIDYQSYDSRHKSAHSRKCIDGTITGSSKCVGYCEYECHPGFLTEKLREKHRCLEKKCIYYIPKQKNNVHNIAKKDNDQEHILALSASVTSNMEGMKVMRANRNKDGGWTIFYISISEYFFDAATRILEENTGSRVKFVNLEYRFDIAADLIFGVKGA
jgi:hypothetical protein